MKTKILHISIVLLLVQLAMPVLGQPFTSTYDFAGVSTSGDKVDPTPVPTATGVTFGSFKAVGNMSAKPNAASRFSFTNWPLGATDGSNVFSGSINTSQYYEVTISPQPGFALSLTSVTFTLQRSGTGIRQYVVRSSIDNYVSNLTASISPANSNLQVVADNVFQVSDGATTAQDGSVITLTEIANIPGSVTFRFYGWNAEASGGTFSIDNVKFTGSTAPLAGSPALTVDKASMLFPATPVSSTSTSLSYTITGENLTDPVTISSTGAFMVSGDNVSFSSSLSLLPAEVATAKTIYVRFNPSSVGSFSGTISNSSTGAFTRTITTSGEGFDPSALAFNFNSCTATGLPGSGFTSYNVTGAQKWACSAFGRNSTNGVDINGYSGGAQNNEDWLISPPLSLASITNIPVLSFYSKGEYSGPSLQLLVSTDYDGYSDPNTATWTTLPGNFPMLSGSTVTNFTLSDNISLAAYKTAPKLYIAFKYVSSSTLGAARWTIDDIAITDQSNIFSVSPTVINLGEAAVGASSVSQPIDLNVIGYGDLTLTASSSYQLSLDNINFSNSITVPEATAAAGTTVYVRFTPSVKALLLTEQINFSGTGLNQDAVSLSGTSYPKSETLDVACYNLSFFGSNSTNNPTPAKIDLQVANITTVIQRLNMDVIGIEEMSSSTALTSLMNNLPGYDTAISQRWSYSFDTPDPNFPPQKVGFIYNKSTMHLVEQRVMFEKMYDSVRLGLSSRLNDYPSGTPSSFWSSGRLPFMATFDATINGVTRRVRVIDIHAKATGDLSSYNRRKYDAKVLKDTLDAFYKNDLVIIVGDYNDRMASSIYTATTITPYIDFKNDNTNYSILTYDLDAAGKTSFIGSDGMIDHIVISNELNDAYIAGSTQIEPANTYISSYGANTASDHLPVYSRFDLSLTSTLPVELMQFTATPVNNEVMVSWTTANESNSDHFIVQRSLDGKNYTDMATVKAKGNSNTLVTYQNIDNYPVAGKNYYRLKQVDIDGREKLSSIAIVDFTVSNSIAIYPNPVTNSVTIKADRDTENYTAKIVTIDGRVILVTTGSVNQISNFITRQLSAITSGIYFLELSNNKEHILTKFLKQ